MCCGLVVHGDMHERYGGWSSVYVRFRRWAEQGIRDAILTALVDLGLTDDGQHMIDMSHRSLAQGSSVLLNYEIAGNTEVETKRRAPRHLLHLYRNRYFAPALYCFIPRSTPDSAQGLRC
ncbi:MAG: transposase [Sphingomonadales bacterium]|nr:transposase [Sphingomonadales bacterium]